jgi:hypothetical protein
MYVFFFEQIIRNVLHDPTFTLPYWNYSVSTPGIHGVMPKEFRMQNDPVFGSLFQANRNPGVNAGNPIDQGQPDSPLATTALAKCNYKTVGVQQGFCQTLDFPLHGNVHVLVGTNQNMGNVPTAANDPIFWMHHSNIDRLWASWNRAGRQNPNDPAFLNKTFTFADGNGNSVTATVKDFLSITPLKYNYDRFEPVPPCPILPPLAATAVPAAQKRHAVAPGGAVTLGTARVDVNLAPPPEPDVAAKPLAARVAALAPSKRLYLVLRNLKADAQPGVLYHLYLELPPGADPTKAQAHYVGQIQFFDAAYHGEHDSGAAGNAPDKFYSFDVTQLVKSLRLKKKLSDRPNLSIVPIGQPEEAAKPVIGEITLVEQ